MLDRKDTICNQTRLFRLFSTPFVFIFLSRTPEGVTLSKRNLNYFTYFDGFSINSFDLSILIQHNSGSPDIFTPPVTSG